MSECIQIEEIEGAFGLFGHITLHRPAALNALNMEMILALHEILEKWEKNPAILAVVVQSSSEKAFCAGGDIRELYDAGLKNDPTVFEFFKQEYQLDYRIYHYSKPYITFLNGITMGGGVGISLHGRHCVVGENFRFAMPETTIGFFPDIAGSHLLNQCPSAYGMYLGLTGARISREEAYALNLVDYCIDLVHQSDVIHQLHQLDLREDDAHQKISKLLLHAHHAPAIEPVFDRLHWVSDAFSEESVEKILTYLEKESKVNPALEKVLTDLKAKSPMSLKITFEQLKRTQFESLDNCLKMDYVLVHHFLQDHDFYEGVRALIVDKDNKPQWKPAKLEDITESMVSAYFESTVEALSFDI